MFTKRHEYDLAEIKALTYELSSRLQEVQEELASIKQGQERLEARVQAEPTRAPAEGASYPKTPKRKMRNRQASASGRRKPRRAERPPEA
jgi:hypothetical protein